MNKRISIAIASPVDHEKLTAEIIIDDKYVVIINQEDGEDKLKIEFFDNPDVIEVGFDIFIEALYEAKMALVGK
jgi:hypothetical protein